MKISVYQPLNLAEDFPEPFTKALRVIEEKLAAITGEQVQIESQRNELRALDPGLVKSADIEKMRALSHKLLGLFQDELRVRGRELGPWFAEGLFAGVKELLGTLSAKLVEARANVRQELEKIGYDETGITPAFVDAHTEVRDLIERTQRLERLRFVLGNSDSAGSNYAPRWDNTTRCEELQQQLKHATTRAQSPLQEAAFI